MRIIITILLFAISLSIYAQEEVIGLGSGGFAYGFKGGPTIATQNWNGFQRNGLISYHGDLFVESLGGWKQNGKILQRSGFQAQLGYHRKG
jgi:hypothetical protein